MLPCRLDGGGDRGASSAGRLVPAVAIVPLVFFSWPCDDPFAAFETSFTGLAAFLLSLVSDVGVLGGVGTSRTGEGRGAGMSVPSVRDPNLKSRAGNSNLVLDPPEEVPVGLDVIVEAVSARFARATRSLDSGSSELRVRSKMGGWGVARGSSDDCDAVEQSVNRMILTSIRTVDGHQ